MSSKSVTIIGGPDHATQVHVDAPTNALLVKVVNPGSGGGVQYLEDTPHVSGDTGTLSLVVRKDAAGSLVSADGDYAPLQVDATGALRVTSTGGGGGTQYAEDTLHVSGDIGTLALVVRQDTPGALAGTDGDYAPLQVDAMGRLRVAVDASVAVAVTQGTSPWVVGDGGSSLTVDGTVAVSNFPATQPVSGTVTVLQGTSPWIVGGTVAVNGVTLDGSATSLGKAQQSSSSASGDIGVAAMAIEQTDGLYYTLGTSNFNLHVALRDNPVAGVRYLSIQKATDAYDANDAGPAVVARVDTSTPTLTTDTWNHLRLTAGGRLKTDVAGTVAVDGVLPGDGVTELGKATGSSYTFGGEVGVAMMTLDLGTLTWQPVLSIGNNLQVVVASLTPGTSATNLGKAEDAVHASGDVGVMMLAVRQDSALALAANGDYIPLSVTAGARLRVETVQASTDTVNVLGPSGNAFEMWSLGDPVPGVTTAPALMFEAMDLSSFPYAPAAATWQHGMLDRANGGIVVSVANLLSISGIDPGTSATNLGKAEDAVHASGDVGVMTLAVRQDTLASSTSATGDYAALKVDSLGALYVNMGNPTSLADGQLATTIGTLLTAGGYTSVTSIDVFNTSSSTTEVVKLYLKQNGGTRRQVRQYTLQPGESVQVIDGDPWNLESSDLIEGVTTNATTVDYFITGLVR